MPAPESGRAGGARKLLLDEMGLEREREPLPPPPVLQLAPVAVEAATPASRKNVKQRMAELEEIAWRNLRAAEEARQVVFAEYARLEREATARSEAENEAAAMKRELEKLRETDERRAAQARFAVTREVRAEVAEEIQKAQAEHAKVVEELNRLRGTLDDHDSLLTEYSDRLREEQLAVASMRADLEKAEDARKRAERELEAIREQAHTRASDEVDRLKAAEIELKETRIARDRLQTEINALKADDAIAAVRAELEEQLRKQAAEVTRLEASLTEQTARAETAEERADGAEQAAVAAHDARTAAEHAASEAASAHEQLSTDSLEAERRAREAEKMLGRLRKEASSSTQARQEAETSIAQAERELSERGARIEEQGRHIDGLESQLRATRSALEELQAWARTAEAHIESLHAASEKQAAAKPEPAAQPTSAPVAPPTPTPVKAAAPAKPATPAESPSPAAPEAPADAAAAAAAAADQAAAAESAAPEEPAPEPAKKKRPSDGPPVEAFRRSAMAELTALAATGDDSKSRRSR